ncbi:FAD-dependent oxidoreductase [Candidatus Poribacteria bacterium]|jgi:flavin-dependent dehydrogenase|nr:FAD-dependent oxidoreductase [Candidatus Poribacteria bacterium]MBT5535740.1 FAD-dependent oxidoreductase [Candidatus Poribacteria bacterium]MBT5714260.1 FAD-dependent oxidoreductase [Candidatus Poribacteria bacterium]MBT7804482.1 FAD-dependent oxidoreductase [Candidatus Poribacteria bacterium]
MTPTADSYDVIVIGGGPAGCTAAALLAEHGRSVLLLERDLFPRFKVGESLMPGTYETFARLGVLDKLNETAFPRKHSVQFYSGSGRASKPFYFSDNNAHESSVTWQVLRSDFDALMIAAAADKGAEVIHEASVHDVLFDGDRAVGVRGKFGDGDIREVRATVVVDASGQSALISRRLKIVSTEAGLRKASIYTHFTGAQRDSGIDEGATIIYQTEGKDSWFWFIPLPEDRASVGVVGDIDYLIQSRDGDATAIFHEELSKCAPLEERLRRAEQAFPMKVTKDFSYRSKQVAGPSWVLVGDAFGFLDPIYSSGIYLALKSGEWAADAVHDAFESDDFSAERLGVFGPKLNEGMEALRKLVYAYYTKDFSFGRFLRRFPECQQGIIDILSGNVYADSVRRIFGPMAEMCELPEEITL